MKAHTTQIKAVKVKGASARRGFTMVELIFVVIFLGILAAIAIAKIGGSTESAILASMKNDARADITALQTYYAVEQDYPSDNIVVTGGKEGSTKQITSNNGTVVKLVASPGNKVHIEKQQCDTGEVGFVIEVTNLKTNKVVTYDSCNDASIKVGATGGK